MPRASVLAVVTDTSQFNPLQLQPRALLSLSFNAMSVWLKEHLVSFPQLIRRHRTSLVILGASIQFEEPLGFFDGDSLDVRATLRALHAGTRAEVNVVFNGPRARAARVRLLLCPVHIAEPASLAASPRALDEGLLSLLQEDEIDPAPSVRPLPELKRRIEALGRPLARATSAFVVHRHLCEVADQWAFFEVPGLVSAGREAMALERCKEIPVLADALAMPLSRFEMELARPYFWFQPGVVDSTAYVWEDRLTFVHCLRSPVPGDEVHGVAVEHF